eukprot:scaffold5228_cov131-Skeletonema_menzelii.AAC.10
MPQWKWKRDYECSLTGAAISVADTLLLVFSLSPPPMRRLIPSTDQAVVNRVKKNPPIMTLTNFRISNEFPKLSRRLGTP